MKNSRIKNDALCGLIASKYKRGEMCVHGIIKQLLLIMINQ